MKPAVLLSALLVAGCSSISWFGQSDAPPSRASVRQVPQNDEQAVAALADCKQQARAVIQRDALIDRDIAGGAGARGVPGLDWQNDSDVDLIRNMRQFEDEHRFDRIVGECMQRRGYGVPEEEQAE